MAANVLEHPPHLFRVGRTIVLAQEPETLVPATGDEPLEPFPHLAVQLSHDG
jgi:hypothetical protein